MKHINEYMEFGKLNDEQRLNKIIRQRQKKLEEDKNEILDIFEIYISDTYNLKRVENQIWATSSDIIPDDSNGIFNIKYNSQRESYEMVVKRTPIGTAMGIYAKYKPSSSIFNKSMMEFKRRINSLGYNVKGGPFAGSSVYDNVLYLVEISRKKLRDEPNIL